MSVEKQDIVEKVLCRSLTPIPREKERKRESRKFAQQEKYHLSVSLFSLSLTCSLSHMLSLFLSLALSFSLFRSLALSLSLSRSAGLYIHKYRQTDTRVYMYTHTHTHTQHTHTQALLKHLLSSLGAPCKESCSLTPRISLPFASKKGSSDRASINGGKYSAAAFGGNLTACEEACKASKLSKVYTCVCVSVCDCVCHTV